MKRYDKMMKFRLKIFVSFEKYISIKNMIVMIKCKYPPTCKCMNFEDFR